MSAIMCRNGCAAFRLEMKPYSVLHTLGSGVNNGWRMVILNDELYIGESIVGKLLKWNGIDAWQVVALKYGNYGINNIVGGNLAVHNGEIFAIGSYDAYKILLKWNGSDTWVAVSQVVSFAELNDICSYNGYLYAFGGQYGKVRVWNGTNALVSYSNFEGACGVVNNGNLYARGFNYSLYQLVNGSFIQVIGESTGTAYNLKSGNNKIYGFMGGTSGLYVWNSGTSWTALNSYGSTDIHIYDVCWFDNNLWVLATEGLFLYNGSLEFVANTDPQSSIFTSLIEYKNELVVVGSYTARLQNALAPYPHTIRLPPHPICTRPTNMGYLPRHPHSRLSLSSHIFSRKLYPSYRQHCPVVLRLQQ